MNLCYLIFIILFIYKIKPSKIVQNFDEIFGNEWNKNERQDKMIKFEQNDQNEQNENTSGVDQMGEEMGNGPNDQQKRETVKKFDAIKEKLKEKGKFEWKNQSKTERKIAKLLGTNRNSIQKWKNELNLKKNNKKKKQFYEQKKRKFIEQFGEFKELYAQGKQKEFVKELGISKDTFRKWKKELAPKYHKTQHNKVDKLKKMKQYYEIKESNPQISDRKITEKLGITCRTLLTWKKKFASFSTI